MSNKIPENEYLDAARDLWAAAKASAQPGVSGNMNSTKQINLYARWIKHFARSEAINELVRLRQLDFHTVKKKATKLRLEMNELKLTHLNKLEAEKRKWRADTAKVRADNHDLRYKLKTVQAQLKDLKKVIDTDASQIGTTDGDRGHEGTTPVRPVADGNGHPDIVSG